MKWRSLIVAALRSLARNKLRSLLTMLGVIIGVGAVIALMALVIVLDQLTKLYIDRTMSLYQSIPVVDGLFSFTYMRNKGAAFSFLSNFNYAVTNDELLINEMQAYLMFTPDPKSFSASKLGVSEGELQQMRSTFKRGSPPIRLPMM